MGDLPNAVVKRLLSKHGDGLRVSGSALDLAVAAAEDTTPWVHGTRFQSANPIADRAKQDTADAIAGAATLDEHNATTLVRWAMAVFHSHPEMSTRILRRIVAVHADDTVVAEAPSPMSRRCPPPTGCSEVNP